MKFGFLLSFKYFFFNPMLKIGLPGPPTKDQMVLICMCGCVQTRKKEFPILPQLKIGPTTPPEQNTRKNTEQNKMLVFFCLSQNRRLQNQRPQDYSPPPEKIWVCAFEKEKRNGATLQVLAEYIETRARKNYATGRLLWLLSVCKAVHFLCLVKIGECWAHTNATQLLIRKVYQITG